ncbi:MAG: hypothetical protein WA063_01080 [Minisyncoccia bacterium]
MIISGYNFDGPYEIGKRIIDRAAIYVIIDRNSKIIDVGQSGETGTRLLNHERKSCWDRNNGKWFVVKWMPSDTYRKEEREELEKKIRLNETPPCGVR